jgi:hypothetical protein
MTELRYSSGLAAGLLSALASPDVAPPSGEVFCKTFADIIDPRVVLIDTQGRRILAWLPIDECQHVRPGVLDAIAALAKTKPDTQKVYGPTAGG